MSNLAVKLRAGNGDVYIAVPEGTDPDEYMESFLARRGDFSGEWVRLTNGHYVRYDEVVAVWVPGPPSGAPTGPRRP